jgi:hypothetical protein
MTTPADSEHNAAPDAEPTAESGSAEETKKRTWVEEVEVAGNQLVDRVKELVQESSTKRAIIKTQDGKELMSVPLTFGVVAGGILTLGAQLLAALGAVAALVSKVKLEVVREEDGPPTGSAPPPPEAGA